MPSAFIAFFSVKKIQAAEICFLNLQTWVTTHFVERDSQWTVDELSYAPKMICNGHLLESSIDPSIHHLDRDSTLKELHLNSKYEDTRFSPASKEDSKYIENLVFQKVISAEAKNLDSKFKLLKPCEELQSNYSFHDDSFPVGRIFFTTLQTDRVCEFVK